MTEYYMSPDIYIAFPRQSDSIVEIEHTRPVKNQFGSLIQQNHSTSRRCGKRTLLVSEFNHPS